MCGPSPAQRSVGCDSLLVTLGEKGLAERASRVGGALACVLHSCHMGSPPGTFHDSAKLCGQPALPWHRLNLASHTCCSVQRMCQSRLESQYEMSAPCSDAPSASTLLPLPHKAMISANKLAIAPQHLPSERNRSWIVGFLPRITSTTRVDNQAQSEPPPI